MTNEERMKEVHKRINTISESFSMIKGGAIVAGVVIAIATTVVTHHVNFRFSNIEKSLEKIEKKVTENGKPECLKITSVLP